MTRVVGNRRTENELEALRISSNRKNFELIKQSNFKGTARQLELMQNFERNYIGGQPMISDEEWDILKVKYNYEESPNAISPSGRSWAKMGSPLPSIDKAFGIDQMVDFINKNGIDKKYKIQCKLDGLTANIRYRYDRENNIYVKDSVMSKGNGRYGLEIHPFALSGVKTNIPDSILVNDVQHIIGEDKNIEDYKFFELRGEAVIPKNEYTYEKYGKNPVWRSLAAGIFNRKIPANLHGLVDYLYGKSLEDIVNEDFKFSPSNVKEGRYFASIVSDKPFLMGDKITVFLNGDFFIDHKDGTLINGNFNDYNEYLDVVFYSCTIGDSNIDTDRIADIPYIKYVSDIDFEDLHKHLNPEDKVYTVSDDINVIKKSVCDFYGVDEDGIRDQSKTRFKNFYEYAMDGVIIKPVDSNRESQGMYISNHHNNSNRIIVPKYPKDQVAVKLLSEIVRVKLAKIETSTTELGNITCSGILDKSYITESGAVVDRVNLHNIEWLNNNSWIKEGGSYDMIMSADIIPVLLNPNM